MAMEWRSELGLVTVSNEVIRRLAGVAVLDCEGLVGMASREKVKDGIAEVLGIENLSKGIEVHAKDGQVSVDMYIIINYGTVISDVARTVQDKVYTTLHRLTGLNLNSVNVYVQGIRTKTEQPLIAIRP